MTINWTLLTIELKRWEDAGLTLPLWWRDDDAIEPTDALDRLAMLAQGVGLPVHLAVIPANAMPELAVAIRSVPAFLPVVHGWAHRNHAPNGEKKAEFGAHRPVDAMIAEARGGLGQLTELLGPDVRPMFVPPWNRVSPDLVAALPGAGYGMLSTFAPRPAPHAAPGLVQVNTHLDPIDWKGHRSLVAPAKLIAQIARQLSDRREGRREIPEPYGILTHHLVHDAAIWDFTVELLDRLMAGPVHPWTAPIDKEPTP